MVELTALPPAIVVLAVGAALPSLSRRFGHGLGVLSTAVAAAWAYSVPAGAYLPIQFLGFDAVLFYVDGFSRLMGIVFGLIGMAAVIYSYSSGADNVQSAFALTYVGSSLGAVFAGDWLTLFVFWELMGVTSTLLVWHHGGRAVRAGYRYALFHGVGGILLLAAIVWHYVTVGSLLFSAADGMAPGIPSLLAVLGIGVNVGFIGLHTWIPDTYPRPHVAASVFLSVYTTKTGVYALVRAFPDGSLAVAYMGGAMAIFGVVYALVQDDMRRLLSYHIQSQVGYMVAGVGIGTALATAGAMAHVFNHILYKSLLFMTVGVVIIRTGRERLSDLGGLYREMPVTFVAFVVAALSIAGFPGFNGFVSKGMITSGAEEQHLEVLRWTLLLGGVGTFMSFIKLGYYAFFHHRSEIDVADANLGQRVTMLSVAALCVFFGVYPDALFVLLPGRGAEGVHPFTPAHIGEGLLLGAAGIAGFLAIRKPLNRLGRVPDIDALYNPLVFYGARGMVRTVTESYATVDRMTVWAASTVTTMARHPASTVHQLATYFPDQVLPERWQSARGTSRAPRLRVGIGTGILVITLTLALVLLMLVVLPSL